MSIIDECTGEDGNLNPTKCYEYGYNQAKDAWRKIGFWNGVSISCAVFAVTQVVLMMLYGGGAS